MAHTTIGLHHDDTRTERDPLGDLSVPASALYGVQTSGPPEFPDLRFEAVAAFVTPWCDQEGGSAHAQGHGPLDTKLADAIIRAADEVLQGKHRDQFIVDPYQAVPARRTT